LLRHAYRDGLERREPRRAAQRTPARAVAAEQARLVTNADLPHLDARPEPGGQLFDELAKVDSLVGGDEVPRGKPAPDIVVAAAAKLGVDVADCIVVEDSEPGVQAALTAGATPVMVPDLQPPSPALRAANVIVLESLAHVRAYLDALACVR